MHQVGIPRQVKDIFGQGHFTGLFAERIENSHIHRGGLASAARAHCLFGLNLGGCCLFSCGGFGSHDDYDLRETPFISTSVPRRPGTAPEITISLVSGSTCKTLSPRTVTRSWPMRPAMRMPLATRPPARPPEPPIEPGERSECFWPCERGPPW